MNGLNDFIIPLHFDKLYIVSYSFQREKKYHGKIIDLTVDHLQYPSGNQTLREIIEHPGGAVVLCVFENSDILLVKQYRHPFARRYIYRTFIRFYFTT